MFVASAVLVGLIAFNVVLKQRSPQYPSAWDPRVASIADWVSSARGLPYKTPVFVDFLSEAEFTAKVQQPTANPTDADRQAAEQTEGYFRSIGLLQGDVDLLASTSTLRGSGTLAFYSTTTKRVTVRGTDLTASVRVTLAHELTHVLQDQHFNLTVHGGSDKAGPSDVLRAVAEGDAVHIEHEFVKQLSEADKTAYAKETEAGYSQFEQTTSAVPDVLRAAFGAPYILGEPFVDFLYATGGPESVNEAFRQPPNSLAAMAYTISYLERRPDYPPEPPAASGTVVEDGTFDAVQLFLMLSARMEAHDALRAVDAWAGDAFVAADAAGKVCTDIAFAGRIDGDMGKNVDRYKELSDLLTTWATAMPAEAGATVTFDGTRLNLRSCDPGTAADQKIQGQPSQNLAVIVVRIYAMGSSMKAGNSAAKAQCAATGFVNAYTVEQLRDQSSTSKEEVQQKLTETAAACPV